MTATLPAALLVIIWWSRGKLSWQRDVLPLLPWFAGKRSDAMAEFKTVLRYNPNHAEAHDALGAALYESGRFTEAVAEFTQPCGSIQIWRGYAIIWNLRGERPALRSNSNRFHFRIGFIVRGSYAQ